jgi:hypothetical protein
MHDFLNYALRNVAPSWGGSGTLYLSLHTNAVGVGGDQTTNEVAYTTYARIAVTRSSGGGWTAAAAGSSSNNALLQFGNCTAGGPVTVTHVALGENASSTGTVLYTGALASSLIINTNVQPQFSIGALVITEA